MYKEKIFVCGGDIRSVYAAEFFAANGYEVDTFGLKKEKQKDLSCAKDADIVVLGLPCANGDMINMPLADCRVEIGELFEVLKKGTLVFAGAVNEKIRNASQRCSLVINDYSQNEVFMEENALYTAEGTLCEIIQRTEKSLCDTKILVTGSGRIADALAVLLLSSPAKVTICARSDTKRACFCRMGFETLWPAGDMSEYDVIVNTVPCDIIGEDSLKSIRKDALILDLSQRPGYVNKDLCKKYCLNLVCLPGIPRLSAPRSAGEAIARAVLRDSLMC